MLDVRRYPISIGLSNDATVELQYPAVAFLTAKDLQAHNQDPNAHANIIEDLRGKFSFDGETLFNFINFGYFEGMPPGPPQAASPAIRGSALNLSPGSFSRPREIPHGDTLVFFEGFASFGEDETLILNNL